MTRDKLIQEGRKVGSETEARYISGSGHKGGEGTPGIIVMYCAGKKHHQLQLCDSGD